MMATKIPPRIVALSLSAAVHVALMVGLLALRPGRPQNALPRHEPRSSAARYAPPRREADPASDQSQQPASRRSASPPRNRLRTARSTSDTITVRDAPLAVVPLMVARAAQSQGDAILNHLWQSTLFALVIGGLTLVFRKSNARVRYWMWFAVAVKFLLPFALLQAAGGSLLGPTVTAMAGVSAGPSLSPVSMPFAFTQITEPFVGSVPGGGSVATGGGGEWIPMALLLAWALGIEFVLMQRLRAWRVVRAAVRASTPFALPLGHLPPGTHIRRSATVLEPAVVGIWRPILLLPDGIDRRLSPAELEAVIAHEACHIASRDNLTAAVQMLVECIFWFHPLVWWIGGRLIQERERACDEHVLGLLQNPRVYADGIVNVCKLYVGPPLPCVPAVSSSDLRQRIERIMRNETGQAVSRRTRVALGIAVSLTLIVPIVAGAVTAVPGSSVAQTPTTSRPSPTNSQLAFQAMSIKQNVSASPFARVDVRSPGRFTAVNVPALTLIQFAFALEDFDIVGAPRWLQSEHYDLIASSGSDATVDQKRAMLRQALQERFKLTAHTETRELPTYALMMARSDGRLGPGLHRSTVNCATTTESALGPDAAGFGIGSGVSSNNLRWVGSDSPAWAGMPSCGFFGPSPDTNLPAGRGGLSFRGLTMSSLARTIQQIVHRSVVDETKLPGSFDGDFGIIEELPPPPPPPGMANPFTSPFLSIFTEFPERLGLKLQSTRGSVSVLVLDAVERPTPD